MNILPAGSSVIPLHQANTHRHNYSWELDAVTTKRPIQLQYARTTADVTNDEGMYMFSEPIRGYAGFIYVRDDVEYDGN